MVSHTAAVAVTGTDAPIKAATAPAAAATSTTEVDNTPAFRRGFLLMPHVGVEYPLLNSSSRSGTGYRFGALIGGHLNKDYSFGVEPVFAIGRAADWFDDQWGNQTGERYQRFEGTIALLRHLALPWGEFVAGPKLGASYVQNRADVYPYDSSSFSLQIGAKTGLLWAPAASPVALGLVLDLAYMRLSGIGDGRGSNTLITALSAALLL